MSRDFFKDAKEKVKKKLEAEEALENLPEEAVGDETAVEATPVEKAEEVPDENVENLTEPEEAVEEEENDTSSAANGEGGVDVEAVMAENKAMKEEIESLRKALQQAGELAKESTVAVTTGDLGDVDFSAFMYGDEEAKKGATGKLIGYLMSALKAEATPIIAERDEAKRALEVQKAIKTLSAMEDMFPGFGKESDAIEALIGRDKVLSAYEDPMHQRVAAYFLNEGLKAVKKGKTGMSLDELMGIYRNNEEFKAAIEQDRLEQLEKVGELPVVPMGGSFSAAEPYKAEQKPQTMSEARKKSKKKYFG